MFGYIKPDAGELKVRQLELYKAVYCGICVTGGKSVSRLTRVMLSYDFVFLALLRLAFTHETYSLERRRCVYNPLRKKRIMAKNEALQYTSAAFAVLSYYKLIDDINDTKSISKVFKYILIPLFSRMKGKALKLYPELDEIIRIPLEDLQKLEKNDETSPDAAADCFARLMSGLLSNGLEGPSQRIAKECGYHLGRYVYLVDACDDLADDFKTNSFNPLKPIYKTPKALAEDPKTMDTTLKDSMNAFLLAFSLDDHTDDDIAAIIVNTASIGATKVQFDIFKKLTDKLLK